MKLTLKRVAYTHLGTFGVLIDEFPFAVTVERPWLMNIQFKSCVPAGLYVCHKTVRESNGQETFEVADVPGRYAILFHVANTAEDVEGCIGVGDRFGMLNNAPAVLDSLYAFNRFMNRMNGYDLFDLEITD